MIIGKNEEWKAVLLRCGCSHSWENDRGKYGHVNAGCIDGGDTFCRKCGFYGWRITGKTDEELRRREFP